MSKQVGVYIDHMNAYNGARRAFFPPSGGPSIEGQYWPQALGARIVSNGPPGRELKFVRVFRGIPDPRKTPRANRACNREIADWRLHSRVSVYTRPVKVYADGAVREKGIDVQIAIDLVLGALRGLYDVAVLFSNDNDLLPAVEAVRTIGTMIEKAGRTPPHIEVAAWKPDTASASQLRLPDGSLYCHLMASSEYELVKNPTDYAN